MSLVTAEIRSCYNDIPPVNQDSLLVKDIMHINLTQGDWKQWICFYCGSPVSNDGNTCGLKVSYLSER